VEVGMVVEDGGGGGGRRHWRPGWGFYSYYFSRVFLPGRARFRG